MQNNEAAAFLSIESSDAAQELLSHLQTRLMELREKKHMQMQITFRCVFVNYINKKNVCNINKSIYFSHNCMSVLVSAISLTEQ